MSDSKPQVGAFCWAELQTSDAAGAKAFYTELMGWEAHDDDVPGGGTYTMFKQGDGNVAAMFQLTEEMRAAGAPPNWMPYIKVDSAVDAAATAKDNGATIVMEAMDVMDIGAMAVIRDPGGAVFSLWQEKIHHGYDFTDARTGTVCWHEILTKDVDQAGKFYADTFGWSAEATDSSGMPYVLFKQGDVQVAGMMGMSGPQFENVPPHWGIYLAVDNCDEMCERVERLGGKILTPPMDIPGVGRFATMMDPQQAVFAVIAGLGD